MSNEFDYLRQVVYQAQQTDELNDKHEKCQFRLAHGTTVSIQIAIIL